MRKKTEISLNPGTDMRSTRAKKFAELVADGSTLKDAQKEAKIKIATISEVPELKKICQDVIQNWHIRDDVATAIVKSKLMQTVMEGEDNGETIKLLGSTTGFIVF